MNMWTSYDVRKLCIEKNWYTHGDSYHYEKMLEYVQKYPTPTDAEVELVALDICIHSDGYSIYDEEDRKEVFEVLVSETMTWI